MDHLTQAMPWLKSHLSLMSAEANWGENTRTEWSFSVNGVVSHIIGVKKFDRIWYFSPQISTGRLLIQVSYICSLFGCFSVDSLEIYDRQNLKQNKYTTDYRATFVVRRQPQLTCPKWCIDYVCKQCEVIETAMNANAVDRHENQGITTSLTFN